MYYPFIYNDEKFAMIIDSMVPGVDPYRYMVSTHGKILDLERQMQSSVSIVGCGYLNVMIHTKQRGFVHMLVHRLVAMAFIPGNWSLQVNHIDGNKFNNHVSNLEWVTVQENLLHAVNTGLNYRGEDKPNAILTNEQAREICIRLEQSLSFSEIINQVGLEDSASIRGIISDIKRGKSFKFISKDYNINREAVRDRDLTNEQVKIICEKIQENPSLTPAELTDILGYTDLDTKSRKNMRNKIGSIKLRKAYTNISKDYKW